MTERKPPDLTFESWIDKQVREASERGEFDNLPGTGKPIPGSGHSYDENWWLRGYLRREGVSADAMLPASLLLRRDLERLPETVRDLRSEREVRETVSELNRRVVEWLRMPHGPHVPVAPADVEQVVAQWRAARPATTRPARQSADAPTESGTRKPGIRWWRRLFRRGR